MYEEQHMVYGYRGAVGQLAHDSSRRQAGHRRRRVGQTQGRPGADDLMDGMVLLRDIIPIGCGDGAGAGAGHKRDCGLRAGAPVGRSCGSV